MLKKPRGKATPETFVAARMPGDTSRPRKLRLRTADGEVEDLILSADALRRFRKTIANVREKRRYLVVRANVPGFTFYYNVTDHGYGLDQPQQATLFHQRDQAKSVAALLGPGVRVIRRKTRTRQGVLVPVLPSRRRTRSVRKRE
jgi:hypothetical protein